MPTVPVNEYHALYGKLIGRFFELYCNDWRFKTPYLFPDVIRERMNKLFDGMLLTATVDWSAPGCGPDRNMIVEQAVVDAIRIMEGPSLNYFLSTRAEIAIELKLSSGDYLTGRLDFAHTEPLSKLIWIFDGKGTGTVGKNVSNDQLYWYALLYFIHFKVLPTQLAFYYFRLDHYDPIPFNLDILNDFRARVSLTMKSIVNRSTFEATPCAKACKYCPYANSCSEGMLSKASRKKPSKVTGLSDEGIIEFGLD